MFYVKDKEDNILYQDNDLKNIKKRIKYTKYDESELYIMETKPDEIIIDFKLYNVDDFTKIKLEKQKNLKKEEINEARDKAEQGGFEYLGKIFDSDPISCQRISLASQTALMGKEKGLDFNVIWTCQDNTTIELDADKMIGVSIALTQWSNTCHTKALELKAKVDEATTEEEINNITWEI